MNRSLDNFRGKMRLQDYTNFIIKFSQLDTPPSSRTTKQARFELELTVVKDLQELLGLKWQEFVNHFTRRCFPAWCGNESQAIAGFCQLITHKRKFFIIILAEFCESLISSHT